jgi:hypothetical protein
MYGNNHTDDAQVLSVTVKILDDRVTWRPDFCTPVIDSKKNESILKIIQLVFMNKQFITRYYII